MTSLQDYRSKEIFIVKRSYEGVDDKPYEPRLSSPVNKTDFSFLSLHVDFQQPFQNSFNIVMCLLLLSTLPSMALVEAVAELEKIRQKYNDYFSGSLETNLFQKAITVRINSPQEEIESKNKDSEVEEYVSGDDYEEETVCEKYESPHIISSFLKATSSMPIEASEYSSIYSDEELDSFNSEQ